MHKRITIFLFIIFNLNSYSQVVIKDEIILDDKGIYKGTESVSLTMPFYGKIRGCVNWGAMWGGWLKRVIISAGGQTVNKGFD